MVIDDLNAIATKEKSAAKKTVVRCCMAAGCMSSRSDAVKKNLEQAVKDAGLGDEVEVRGVGCMKLCCEGPLVSIDTQNALYEEVEPEDALELIKTLKGGETKLKRGNFNHPFFKKQFSIVLANSGEIDPERIEAYIAADGYQALHHVLRELTPKDVVDAMVKSGLRGRGGAGFPTGIKWGTVAKTQSAQKYVICNADEGDPGAFMDRSVLESDPHSVLEGMAISAYAVGANQGFIYVRAEYPLAIKRLQIAIKQAKQLGLLGSGIFESPFNFNIDIRIGAGAFVCGEETALMASVEGKRGTPRPRPPFPAESGLWGCPTLINNVETFANVPPILRKGAEWFASIGTEKSKGTKVFALAGKIINTGLIEVPMGTPLRQIVEEMGGGAPDGRKIKAVQTGGPSGGCIPSQHLDTPVDYESLGKLGSIMGSGGMIVMDDSTKMVDVARYFMEFCVDESCGKCIPCRAGTLQMLHLLEKILNRKATARDLAKLEELCDMVRNTSLCGLGQTAPNPTMSTLRFFRNEYEELLQSDEFDPHKNGELKKRSGPFPNMNKKLHIAGVVIAFIALTTWNLFSAESVVTPAMAGHWEGNARIIVSWCHQKNLTVAVDIHADGSVTGKTGDATLIGGRFEANRGWLGRKLNLATDYIITGKLNGAIVAAEGIARDKIYIPLDLKDNAFVGGVNTSGSLCVFSSEKTMKEKMGFSARSLKLIRSPSSP